MNIADHTLGPGHPVYIIAELGVNHDGSPQRALELTRIAKDAGADAIKLQLFEADRLMSRAAKLAAYQKAAGERDPVEMLRRLEMPVRDMAGVVDLAHALGMHAIVTVFSVELVPAAQTLAWDAYKSASPDIVNRPLLEAMAATGKPLILSTGASTLEEVARAVGWLSPWRNRLAMLQCVSSYPTPVEQSEMLGMHALRTVFDGPIGYSDHTPGRTGGMEAVLLGAAVLEKHLTYDTSAAGPDHAASLSGADFAAYARGARRPQEAAQVFTPKEHAAAVARVELWTRESARMQRDQGAAAFKRLLPIEQDVRAVSRQSLVAARPLHAGHVIQREDLTIKRPGTGTPPHELMAVVGGRVTREIEADMPVLAEDVEKATSGRVSGLPCPVLRPNGAQGCSHG